MSSSAATGVAGLIATPALAPQLLDEVHRAVQVGQDLECTAMLSRTGVDERLDIAIRVLDHQVHVERQSR